MKHAPGWRMISLLPGSHEMHDDLPDLTSLYYHEAVELLMEDERNTISLLVEICCRGTIRHIVKHDVTIRLRTKEPKNYYNSIF